MVSNVEELLLIRPTEIVRVDSDKLGRLYMDMGDVAAEEVVCRAMEELALRLAHCDRLYRADNMDDLRKSSRSLIAIADQIGMSKLARVAGNVTECIDEQNHVALAATLGRLMRIGEGSLTAIWDLQDLTI